MLTFPDDTQVRVTGLTEIMGTLFSKGFEANEKTVEEIIKRLEARKNYIPSSERARKQYAYVLLKEYRKYVKNQTDKNE